MNDKRFLGAASAVLLVVVVIFMLAPGAWAQSRFKTLYKFHGKDGASPQGPLIFDAAGNLYGTSGGGEPGCDGIGCGTAYQLAPNADGTWTLKVMHYFTPDEDFWPSSGVALDAAGNLYGMTDQGSDDGDVYELTPQAGGGWSETVLHKFAGAYDGNPQGGMTVDASGNLYGTSGWGCGSGWGLACVFEMSPSGGSWTFNQLVQFPFGGSTGWYPSSTTPVFDAKGNLYATTAFGGNSGCSPYGNGCYGLGVVFELSPNGDGTWSLKDLHKFTGGLDGESPTCPLALDAAGNLYGTTYAGGEYGVGNVFRLSPNVDGTWSLRVLHEFTGGKDGSWPMWGVILDPAGNLYGMTYQGGAHGYGLVYKLSPTLTGGWHETVLHAFTNTPGAYPWGGLVFDGAGNLYGTTTGDGGKTFGSVFEIVP